MKKFLVLMAALALVFAFVACGDDDDPVTPPASSSSVASSAGSSNSTSSSTSSAAAATYTVSGKTLKTDLYGIGDGGVTALRAAIVATTSTAAEATLTPAKRVQGVITAIEYTSATTYKYFWMQDDQAGIFARVGIAPNTGTVAIGAPVTMDVERASWFNGLAQINAVTASTFTVDNANAFTWLSVRTAEVVGGTTAKDVPAVNAQQGLVWYLPAAKITAYATQNADVEGWDNTQKIVRMQNPSTDWTTAGPAMVNNTYKMYGPIGCYNKVQLYLWASNYEQVTP